MKDITFGFVGAGNMANAMIQGLLSSNKCSPEQVFVFDVDEKKMLGMKQHGVSICYTLENLVRDSVFIFLAVKPQNYSQVLEEIKSYLNQDHVLISIAAGISTDFISNKIDCKCPVVRVMTNTPLLLRQGATAICRPNNISDDKFNIVYNLFEALGVVEILPEYQMSNVIAVNGSSPAYIFLLAKAMMDFSTSKGIDSQTSLNLVCQTLKGSAQMLSESGYTPDELIRMVSSPRGTTIEALKVFEKNDFYHTFIGAMTECTRRANELSV